MRLGQLIENVGGANNFHLVNREDLEYCLFQLDDKDVAEIRRRLEALYERKYGQPPHP